MKLLKLQLQNFRNYKDFELKFNNEKPIALITGENGKGKTNLLESIYLLSVGKTFRGADQDDLLKWGMDFFIIKGESETKDGSTNFELSYTNYPRKHKSFKINDVKKKHAEYIGNFLTVLFHPKDLNMLYLEPSLRRKYLNLLLSQTDKYYLEALSNYTRLLKQRNALLDEVADGKKSADELEPWDEKIAESGTALLEKRHELIEFFNKNIQQIYRKISGGKENLQIKYKNTVGETPGTESTALQAYIKKLKLKRDRDIRYGSTSVGPHRDDIKFILNDKDIEDFASRGEFRTILISLKIAEISYIEKKTKEPPLLLLDDVFSELDESRQKQLLEAIKKYQTIITTTELTGLDAVKKSANIIAI
jgi:DNA replication and repair protein RecF